MLIHIIKEHEKNNTNKEINITASNEKYRKVRKYTDN